jgi:hypothetical protein
LLSTSSRLLADWNVMSQAGCLQRLIRGCHSLRNNRGLPVRCFHPRGFPQDQLSYPRGTHISVMRVPASYPSSPASCKSQLYELATGFESMPRLRFESGSSGLELTGSGIDTHLDEHQIRPRKTCSSQKVPTFDWIKRGSSIMMDG